MPKHLNIGCNIIYKPDYINIDESNEAIADLVCPLFKLPFEDNSIDSIDAYGVIEQLTYEKAFISLLEWFRVLKPAGRLNIETVNADQIIRYYTKSDDIVDKEFYLKKLFESDIEYKNCSSYFFFMLKSVLTNIGFENVEEIPAKIYPFEEYFKLTTQKPLESKAYMTLVKTQKNTFEEIELLNFDTPKIFWEFNHAIMDSLARNTLIKINSMPLQNIVDFHKIATYSPKVARSFAKECLNSGFINNNIYKYIDKTLECLINNNIVLACYKIYLDKNKDSDSALNYYLEVFEQNTSFLADLFTTPEELIEPLIKKYIEKCVGTPDRLTLDLSSNIYSLDYLKIQSDFLQLKATKSIVKADIESAYNLLNYSKDLNPDNILTYLNLGILEAHNKNYDTTLRLFKFANRYKDSEKINVLIGLCYLYLRNFEEAARLVSKVENDSILKFLVLGISYYYLENPGESLDALTWATISQKEPIAYINLGVLYEQLNNKKEAENNFNKAKALNPNVKITHKMILPSFRKSPFTLEEI